MKYWVAVGGQQYGPFPLGDLRRMITEGRVALTDLAWTEGMSNWSPLSQVLPPDAPTYAPLMPPPSPPSDAPTWEPASLSGPDVPQAPPLTASQRQPPDSEHLQAPPPGSMPYRAGQPGGAWATGPLPPSFHWGWVLLLSLFTAGIFGIVWVFVEAGFVKKIDPRSSARVLIVAALLLNIAGAVLSTLAMFPGTGRAGQMLTGVSFPLSIAAAICLIVAMFQMRSSMLRYYNTVEPIQLRLSAVMTFFFHFFYFQHHFTRIARWKKTGLLTPQGG